MMPKTHFVRPGNEKSGLVACGGWRPERTTDVSKVTCKTCLSSQVLNKMTTHGSK